MRKVLIVDDYNSIQDVYFDLLRKDYIVEACTDTNEIMLRIKRFQPDIILINNDLPNFNSHEFCALASEELGIPTILLIHPQSSATININNCKADELLTKPVDREEVLQVIARLLALRQ